MMKGIDVSYANGVIDWRKAQKEVQFAILRSSFGSDCPEQVDEQFERNAKGCVRYGIPFGIYHFAYFVDEATARAEAAFVIRLAKKYPQVRMIALDMEEDSERYARRQNRQPDWTACAVVFLEEVRRAGFVPVLYTNQNWIDHKLDFNRLKKYALWYAAPDVTEEVSKRYGNLALWQSSWQGKVSGISGAVDLNCCYDDSLWRQSGTQAATKKSGDKLSQVNSSQKTDFRVRVTASSGVNLRSGAGIGYSRRGVLPYGSVVTITRTTSGGGYRWGLAEASSVQGWLALDFTETISSKSVDALALEVLQGRWDSGAERKRRLTAAGYDYAAVQARVNELMR